MIHDDSRTSLHRIKAGKAEVPLVLFGAAVMFKLPETQQRTGDLEDRFEQKGLVLQWCHCHQYT